MNTFPSRFLAVLRSGASFPARRQIRFLLEIAGLSAVGAGLILAGLALPAGRTSSTPPADLAINPRPAIFAAALSAPASSAAVDRHAAGARVVHVATE